MIRITQQRNKCIGCNACVEAACYRWRISRKDGKCTLIGGKEKKVFFFLLTGDDEYEDNMKAMKHCPVNIIRVETVQK
jgi:ferredoxin